MWSLLKLTDCSFISYSWDSLSSDPAFDEHPKSSDFPNLEILWEENLGLLLGTTRIVFLVALQLVPATSASKDLPIFLPPCPSQAGSVEWPLSLFPSPFLFKTLILAFSFCSGWKFGPLHASPQVASSVQMSSWVRVIFNSQWTSYVWREKGDIIEVPYLTLRVLSNCEDVGEASVLKRSLGQNKMWMSWWGILKALPRLWKEHMRACVHRRRF